MRITLTDTDLIYLTNILNHLTDYMLMDDRPDHGLGMLTKYRFLSEEKRKEVIDLYVKLARANERKHRHTV